MTSAGFMRALFGVVLIFCLSGCFVTKQPQYPVNSHDSTPVSQRKDQNEYARINDQTTIVAFEYGRCNTDADCAPRGCDHAVCAPRGLQDTCISDQTSACLSSLPSSLCGCTDEGVCRWTRNNQVMQCAAITVDKVQTRPYYGAEGIAYPWRPYY